MQKPVLNGHLLITSDPNYHDELLNNGYAYYPSQDVYINTNIHTIVEPVCKNTFKVYYDALYNKIVDFAALLKKEYPLSLLLNNVIFDKVMVLSAYTELGKYNYPTEHQWLRIL